ncbi:glycoside hydrolase family 10 protein [Candidatus Neomarinimicrobiota bacterium]
MNKLCLWIVRDALYTSESVSDIVRFAHENKYKHLFVQVRGRGDAYYNSNIVVKNKNISDTSYDPLADIIDKAHAVGIQIHAWVNVYLLWTAPNIPTNRTHLMHTKPGWIDSQFKSNQIDISNNSIVYLAPHNSSVNTYLLNVFREILINYDVDGLHLDYLRYADENYGNNADAIKEYIKNDRQNPKYFYTNKDKGLQSNVSDWNQFKIDSISDLVKSIKMMMTHINPDFILSAAVKPNLAEAKSRYFQDWEFWLMNDYLDWVVLMNYAAEFSLFANNVDYVRKNFGEIYKSRIIIGLGIYNQSVDDFSQKVTYTYSSDINNLSIFSYNYLINNLQHWNSITNQLDH